MASSGLDNASGRANILRLESASDQDLPSLRQVVSRGAESGRRFAFLREGRLIDSGLTRKVRTLQRDLGWALLMCREGVLSDETFRRLLERFQDTSTALSGNRTRHDAEDRVLPGHVASSPPRVIADWIQYLESYIRPHLIRTEPRSGPPTAV